MRSDPAWAPPPEVAASPARAERRDQQEWGLGNVDVSVISAPVGLVLADIAAQVGASFSVAEEIAQRTVTAELTNAPAEEAVRVIAENLDLAADYSGGVIRLLPVERAAKSVVVLPSGYYAPAIVRDTLAGMLPGGSQVRELGGGVVVSGDPRAVEAAMSFAEAFETGPDGWLLDVKVVLVTDRLRRALGLEFAVGGEMTVRAGGRVGEVGASPVVGAAAELVVGALVEASRDGTAAAVLNTAALLVLEGEKAVLRQGERVPVPRRAVSPEGTVTTIGFEYVQTGLTVEASARRIPAGVLLQLTPTLSTMVGAVEGAPITSESSVSISAPVGSGEWVLLAGLRGDTGSLRRSGLPLPIPDTYEDAELGNSSLLFAVRATRVFSSAAAASRPELPPAPPGWRRSSWQESGVGQVDGAR